MPADDHAHAPAAKSTYPWRRRLLGAAFTLAVLTGALALIAVALTQERPAWWTAIDARDPAVIAAAERVENGAATQLTKIRERERVPGADSSAPWTVALKADDANAWLAARLPRWLENQESEAGDGPAFRWPRELGQVQVAFDGGAIHVGAAVRPVRSDGASAAGSSGEQVLGASIRPELRADGSLWMPARWVTLGRLSVPASWMLPSSGGAAGKPGSNHHTSVAKERVPEAIRDLPQTRDLMRVFAGEEPALRRPIIRIGDGRRVELLGLEARDGTLLITCRTLAREQIADRNAQRP